MLEARRHVPDFAEYGRVHPATPPQFADDRQAGVDADPQGEPDPVDLLEIVVEDLELAEKVEGGKHGEVGVALVGGGPTEDGQEAITRIMRHVATATFDHLVAEVLVAQHHVSVVLGVELPRELGRAHHVRERDGEPASLALVGGSTKGRHARPAMRA